MIIQYLIAAAALLGAVDLITGNHLGLGKSFEEGFLCMGSMALTMTGIICAAPLAGLLLKPVLTPFARMFGADASIFGGLLANNMGGYPLAMVLAEDPLLGRYSGLIVSSMLGAALVYTIPVGLGFISEEKRKHFSKGVMAGLIAVPAGCIVGGLMMGVPVFKLLVNTAPVLVIGLLLLSGFAFFPSRLIKGFLVFAGWIRNIGIISLGIAAFSSISSITLIPSMTPVEQALGVVAKMSVLQLGSLPLAAVFTAAFRKPLARIGNKISVDATAMVSLPISCFNVIPVFMMVKDMKPRGIVVASAWLTNVICVFSAHYAYTQSVEPQLVTAVMISKLISGVLAVFLALFLTKEKTASTKI